jgi:serine/threonine-protein phosphatase 5
LSNRRFVLDSKDSIKNDETYVKAYYRRG